MSEQTLRQRNGNDGKDRSARPSSLQGYLNRRITLPFAILSDLRRYDDKNLAIKAPDFLDFFLAPNLVNLVMNSQRSNLQDEKYGQHKS
jgi:hypothetical protein